MSRPVRRRTGALLALALVGCSPAAAEPALPGAVLLEPGVTLQVLEGPAPSAVDEAGLRYYIATGNRPAAAAELQRLHALYPGWSPPGDIMTNPWGGADERPIWAEIHARRYSEAKKAIDKLRSERAGWKPSPQMLKEIERGELRLEVAWLEEMGDWPAVLQALGGRPERLDCTAADLAWSFAEASVRVKQTAAAAQVFRRFVESCPAFELRLASLQKASAVLPRGDVDALVRLEGPHARSLAEQRRFEVFQAELLRNRLVAMTNGRGEPPTAAEIAEMERLAETRRDGVAATLLGWLHYRAQRAEAASLWFERGAAWGKAP